MIDTNKYEVYANYEIAIYVVDMLNVIGATMHSDIIDNVVIECCLYSACVRACIGNTTYIFYINNNTGIITVKFNGNNYVYNYNNDSDMIKLLNLITTIAVHEIA